MTTTWTITQLDRKTEDGFVTTAHWTEGSPEVPYEDLTQEQVLAWVWASGVDKDAVEAAVQAIIDEQKAPKIKQGLPWA